MPHLHRKQTPPYLKEKERDQLDLYAEILGMSRQRLLEAMISSCLNDLETMDKMDCLVSEVRIQDQLEMFKNLSPHEKSLIDQGVNQSFTSGLEHTSN